MEYDECFKQLAKRIQRLDPDHFRKALGYALLLDLSLTDMQRLAFGPDDVIKSLIAKAKAISLVSPFQPSGHSTVSHLPTNYPPSLPNYGLIPLFEQIPGQVYPRFPDSGCYFSNNDGYYQLGYNYVPNDYHPLVLNNPTANVVPPLEQLEMELVQILSFWNGSPVAIEILPQLYYETYGRVLQGEGQGQIDYHSMVRILSQMRRSICLVEMAHGVHAVVLAENAAKFTIIDDANQVYLTFPPDSTFTEQDAYNYFVNFGPVKEIRIPSQQCRMYGFVVFADQQSTERVLAVPNPHLIQGSHVLVKRYRRQHATCHSSTVHQPRSHSMPIMAISEDCSQSADGDKGKGIAEQEASTSSRISTFHDGRATTSSSHRFHIPEDPCSTSRVGETHAFTSEGHNLPENPFSFSEEELFAWMGGLQLGENSSSAPVDVEVPTATSVML